MATTTHTFTTPSFRATVTTFFSESDSASSSSPNPQMLGGYSPGTINAESTALLNKALGNDALYAKEVSKRVCFTVIKSLTEQTVAGTNYKYVVDGCSVSSVDGEGSCSDKELAGCTPETYTIGVFEQSWTNTTTVSGIVSGNAQESTGSMASGADKDKDTSITPAATSATPAAAKSAGRRTSLGAFAVLAMALTASAVI